MYILFLTDVTPGSLLALSYLYLKMRYISFEVCIDIVISNIYDMEGGANNISNFMEKIKNEKKSHTKYSIYFGEMAQKKKKHEQNFMNFNFKNETFFLKDRYDLIFNFVFDKTPIIIKKIKNCDFLIEKINFKLKKSKKKFLKILKKFQDAPEIPNYDLILTVANFFVQSKNERILTKDVHKTIYCLP